jgi:hypothetical protein
MSEVSDLADYISAYAALISLATISIYAGSFASLPVCHVVVNRPTIDPRSREPNERVPRIGLTKETTKMRSHYQKRYAWKMLIGFLSLVLSCSWASI